MSNTDVMPRPKDGRLPSKCGRCHERWTTAGENSEGNPYVHCAPCDHWIVFIHPPTCWYNHGATEMKLVDGEGWICPHCQPRVLAARAKDDAALKKVADFKKSQK